MLAKFIQAATITFVLHLLMGLSSAQNAQNSFLPSGNSSIDSVAGAVLPDIIHSA